MIDILGGMNTKEAILICVSVMVLVNALFVAGCIGILNIKIEAVKGEIIKRINAIVSHIEP